MTLPAVNLHATTVHVAGRGALITGPSGAGKSVLALELLALGAELVADDRTDIIRNGDDLIADVPQAIAGMIEARGVGILRTRPAGPTRLAVVIDLSQTESKRHPEYHEQDILGVRLPCLYRVKGPHFAAAILLYLRCSISSPP